jgi:O-antigen ligase
MPINHALTEMAGIFKGRNNWHYWLLIAPALIVFFFQVGRGLGNTGYLLYWITAVALLVRQRNSDFPIFVLLLFLALLAWGTLSAILSVDTRSALGKWAQYALLGSAYFITWQLVRCIPQFDMSRALKMIGFIGLLSFAYYASRYLFLMGSPDFKPEVQVHGLVSAYLSPFTLYLLRKVFPERRGFFLGVIYLISLSLLLILSNSLTEVLTLAAILVVMAFFVVHDKRLLILSLGAVTLFFFALILLFDPAGVVLSQVHGYDNGWFSVLNVLSSYRMQIWYQALTIPPPNPWLGVGPGNVGLYPPVIISELQKVGHLHNLFLDSWYELGVVGFFLYLSFYGAQIHTMKSGTLNLSSKQRGIVYAVVAGIFVASMLEQSHRSHHVAMFVPFLLALYAQGLRRPEEI